MTEASAILLPTDREEAANTPCDFDALFAAHYARVVAVLFRLVGNRAQAEELADDVFLKLHRQPLAAPREGGQADHN